MRAPLATVMVALVAAGVAWAEMGGVEFTRVRDVFLVPVEVNGVGPYPFILDLGIGDAVINTDVAEYLKLETSSATTVANETGEPVRAFVAPVDLVRLGEQALPLAKALVMDLAGFSQRLGMDVAGIMPGWFPGKELTLDFEQNRAILSDWVSGALHAAPGQLNVRMRVDEGPPTVHGLVNSKHLRAFVLDTTFAAVVGMPEAALRELGILREATPRLVVEPGPDDAPEPLGHTQIRLESLRVGAANIGDPVCTVLESGAQARIGLGFLQHFRVTFLMDKDVGVLSLEPRRTAVLRDPPIVGYGLSLAQYQDGLWRVCVAKGSPASRAGIASGDRIAAINGESMRDQPYAELAARLTAGDGDEIELGLRQRGDQGRTVRLAAKPLL